MAYIFKETELPSLISVVPGRERIFFVNQELAKIDDMLKGRTQSAQVERKESS